MLAEYNDRGNNPPLDEHKRAFFEIAYNAYENGSLARFWKSNIGDEQKEKLLSVAWTAFMRDVDNGERFYSLISLPAAAMADLQVTVTFEGKGLNRISALMDHTGKTLEQTFLEALRLYEEVALRVISGTRYYTKDEGSRRYERVEFFEVEK